MRKSWESVNGKGSTVWAGNTLLVFESHDAEKLAEAFAATRDLVTHSPSS